MKLPIPDKFKANFMAAVLYAEAAGPYKKIGIGTFMWIQPVMGLGVATTPLLYAGMRGAYADIRDIFNGDKKAQENALVLIQWMRFHENPVVCEM